MVCSKINTKINLKSISFNWPEIEHFCFISLNTFYYRVDFYVGCKISRKIVSDCFIIDFIDFGLLFFWGNSEKPLFKTRLACLFSISREIETLKNSFYVRCEIMSHWSQNWNSLKNSFYVRCKIMSHWSQNWFSSILVRYVGWKLVKTNLQKQRCLSYFAIATP